MPKLLGLLISTTNAMMRDQKLGRTPRIDGVYQINQSIHQSIDISISPDQRYKIDSPHQFEGAGWKNISVCPISEHHFLGRPPKTDGVNPTKAGPYA